MKRRGMIRFSLNALKEVLNLDKDIEITGAAYYPETENVVFFLQGGNLPQVAEFGLSQILELEKVKASEIELNEWQKSVVAEIKLLRERLKSGFPVLTFDTNRRYGKTMLAAMLPRLLDIPYNEVAYVLPSRMAVDEFQKQYPETKSSKMFYGTEDIARGFSAKYKLIVTDEHNYVKDTIVVSSTSNPCIHVRFGTPDKKPEYGFAV